MASTNEPAESLFMDRLDLDGDCSASVVDAAPNSLTIASRSALKLPSFDALGITSTHAYKPGIKHNTTQCACSSGTKDMGSAILPCSNMMGVTSPGYRVLSLASHNIATLTPPTETTDVIWASSGGSEQQNAPISTSSGSMAGNEHARYREDSFPTPHLTPGVNPTDASASWLDDALGKLFTSLNSSTETDRVLKVLSHALPCPDPEGHVFTRVMTAFYEHSSSRSTTWINVFHALPGRFSLNDLPKSPPTTPGQPFQGEDYFTQKVFDSAVSIADYHADLSWLPRSSLPAVPPGSVDMAIVERYIPPTSTLEFATMFDINSPSILVDRLIELSAINGSLLFIYPTRSGARTFVREYLSPVLEPLLRTLAVIHSLPTSFCENASRLSVVNKMLDHEKMRSRVTRLCATLSDASKLASTATSSRYELAHASTGSVSLSRKTWAEWWVKQEKPRLQQEIARWSRDVRNQRNLDVRGAECSAASAEVLRQLLDGLTKPPCPAAQTCQPGIEVNVFVIKRLQ